MAMGHRFGRRARAPRTTERQKEKQALLGNRLRCELEPVPKNGGRAHAPRFTLRGAFALCVVAANGSIERGWIPNRCRRSRRGPRRGVVLSACELRKVERTSRPLVSRSAPPAPATRSGAPLVRRRRPRKRGYRFRAHVQRMPRGARPGALRQSHCDRNDVRICEPVRHDVFGRRRELLSRLRFRSR